MLTPLAKVEPWLLNVPELSVISSSLDRVYSVSSIPVNPEFDLTSMPSEVYLLLEIPLIGLILLTCILGIPLGYAALNILGLFFCSDSAI